MALLLLIAVWMAWPMNRIYACSCVDPGSAPEALERSGAVFAGRVVSMEVNRNVASSADPVTVEFDVKTVWKGPVERTIHLTTAVFGVSCGYTFAIGVEYLVYSWNGSEVNLCSRTKPLWEARDDLSELGDGQPLAPSVTPHTPGGPGQPAGGGCGPSPHTDGLLLAGLIVGVAWFGLRKRRSGRR